MSTIALDKFCKIWEERALLYFCLMDSTYLYNVMSVLSVQDFIDQDHQILFSLLLSLHKDGITNFDMPIVLKEAKALGIVEQIGGVDYVKSLYKMNVSFSNFSVILNTVLEASLKYKLYNKLTENTELLLDSNTLNAEEIIGKVETSILDLSTNSFSIKEPVDLSSGLIDLVEEGRQSKIELSGIPTGFPIFDKLIDGLVPGTLNVLAARKKMGKSAVLSNIALHVAFKEKIPVLYIDTEMSYSEFRYRCLASLSGVRERTIKHGGYTDEQYHRIKKAAIAVEAGKLFHERLPAYTVDKLVALYKKFKYKHDIGLAIFDYIKEPDSNSVDRNRKEYQILGDVTTKLKDLAGNLNIPFLTAVQLNRGMDVADSDRVARYADVIAFWANRTEKELTDYGPASGSHKIIIKDSRRGGSVGEKGIGYYFFKHQLRVKEVPPEKQLINFNKELLDDGASDDKFSDDPLI